MFEPRRHPARLEDYAFIRNCFTVAVVSRDGSTDWLSLPRFDTSLALFSSCSLGWHVKPLPGQCCFCEQF